MDRFLKSKLPDGRFVGVDPVRSRIMAAIRGKSNRTTERALRLALVRAGISGWRLHVPNLPGCPDFFFPRCRLAVFVDGCFWHGCPKCGHIPSTRSSFWRAKIRRNKLRDRQTTEALGARGIQVIRLWEHSTKDSRALCTAIAQIARHLRTRTAR